MVNQADIYTATIYYVGNSGDSKDRPVLILDEADEFGFVLIAEITSVPPKNPPTYYDGFKEEIKKWQEYGLNERSFVKCKNTHQVEEDKLINKVGTMDYDEFVHIVEQIEIANS